MALNFPISPNIDDTYTDGTTTWKWDGSVWNIVDGADGVALFKTVAGDTGSATATTATDTITIAGGTDIASSVVGKTLTINYTGSASNPNLFSSIGTDDGTLNATTPTSTVDIIGGTNITTQNSTDTNDIEINVSPFSIDFLSDVDTTTSPPSTGSVIKWDGAKWAPGTDATTGGGGTDADTLDGQDGSYYLNYNNLSNTPSVLTLTDLSIGNELTASGDGAISYDNTTGVFRFTPPDLSSYLTSVPAQSFSSLTGKPTTLAGYGITDAFDGAFSSLTSKPTTLAGYGITDAALASSIPTDLTDLNIIDGTANQVLTTNGAGGFSFQDISASSGETNQNAFSNVAVAGQTTVAAESKTDTLTLVGGTSINVTTDANTDSVTIAYNGASGVTEFSNLTDVNDANFLTVDRIFEHAATTFTVDNIGATSYTFNPHYAGNNPSIYLISGHTYAFNLLGVGGHPFEIQDASLNALTTNLLHVAEDGTVSADSDAQGQDDGTLYWRIPENTSGSFAYQCTLHSAMVGSITVKRLSSL
jgi:hypothetical protein